MSHKPSAFKKGAQLKTSSKTAEIKQDTSHTERAGVPRSSSPEGGRPSSGTGGAKQQNVLDVLGTSHRPDGPWPAADHSLIAAWFKLECLEMTGKKHESGVSQVDDSVVHGHLTVVKPYAKGEVLLEVEGLNTFDLSDASESTPVMLYDETNPDLRLFVTAIKDQQRIQTLPTEGGGPMRQILVAVKATMMQPITDFFPMYRRNVLNFMPSLRFEPQQCLSYIEYSYLQRKLSGPVAKKNFTLFLVGKGYTNVGSSPWPVFAAVDAKTAYGYQLHVVIEQQAGKEDSFQARWKILCGPETSEKTEGIDPTRFSIITVQKVGRLMRLFINGCENGHAAAEFIIEEEEDYIVNITDCVFGMDINGAKFLDGEISEFLAYSDALTDAQIDSVGRYLSRKFALDWTWNPPKDRKILEEWLEKKARGKIKKHDGKADDDAVEIAERSTYKEDLVQVEQTMRGFAIPEEALPVMTQMARMARFPRRRMLMIKANPFDTVFDYMHSAQTLIKVAAVKLLGLFCKDDEGLKIVLARDGLFLLLRACEPEWKKALEALMAEKKQLYDKAVVERELVKDEMERVDKTNVSNVFQYRMRLKYCDSMVEEARLQMEGVYKRMNSGVEQMNNYELVRTAANAIAVIVDKDDESKELLIKISGLNVLDRVLDTPNIPVQTSICKVISALVRQEKVAFALVKEGMVGKIVRLMFLDDPPVQCEAAAIILRTIVHKDLRDMLLQFDLLKALERMLSGPYEDNYLASTRVLHILATHNDSMRRNIVKCEGTIKSLVKILKSRNLEVRQRGTQALAYIMLTDEGSAALWATGFAEIVLDMLEDPDRVVLTHVIMMVANGSRNEVACRKLFKMGMPKIITEIGLQAGIAYQHLCCGVLSNLATVKDKKVAKDLFTEQVLGFLVRTLSVGSLHARYTAATALRRLSWLAPFAEKIVEANALAALIDMARKPRIIIDQPALTSISKEGRSLYMHWQAGRVIAALACSPNVHLQIVRGGGLFALIQLCESGLTNLQREGAASLAFIAEVRCETECILQMAEAGAIDALQALTESPDDALGAEAMRALSSLLNFDSAWT